MGKDNEELPPANVNPVIDELECPPPSSFRLKLMLRGKTDPADVMQSANLYSRRLTTGLPAKPLTITVRHK